ncbi:MAG: hypothetical protein HC913_11610 [Microscillaceae bacterium]|nr:hypothetical protein [Microscillaceae bacterium]
MPFLHHIQYFWEQSPAAAFEELQHRREGLLPLQKGLNFGYNKAALWLRLELMPPDTLSSDWMLIIRNPSLWKIDAYLPMSEGGWQKVQTGTYLKYEQRPFWNRFWVFPLRLDPGQNQVVFLRIQAKGSALSVPLSLKSEKDFYAQSLPGEVGYGIFFGMLALVILLNLFLFVQLRQRQYALYGFLCYAWAF